MGWQVLFCCWIASEMLLNNRLSWCCSWPCQQCSKLIFFALASTLLGCSETKIDMEWRSKPFSGSHFSACWIPPFCIGSFLFLVTPNPDRPEAFRSPIPTHSHSTALWFRISWNNSHPSTRTHVGKSFASIAGSLSVSLLLPQPSFFEDLTSINRQTTSVWYR